jgi:hypothetical protein
MYSTPIETDHNRTYTLHIIYCLKVSNYRQDENATLMLHSNKFNMYRPFFSNYFPYKFIIKQKYAALQIYETEKQTWNLLKTACIQTGLLT